MGASVEPLLKEDGQPYTAAVLIPTINNAEELEIVLERLSKQTYPHFEVVISDSKSKDHTKHKCVKNTVQHGLMIHLTIVQMHATLP